MYLYLYFVLSAGKDDKRTMILCMDLQQALPTPRVTTGMAFYLRKLMTYNFCIHDYRTGHGHMFVWDEVTANRGAAEIISCINKFIAEHVPEHVDKLYMFSDNCSGQNKNIFLIMFYLSLIHSGRFKEITHIYFRPGHTYMAADRDFALIEKKMNTRAWIMTPDEHIDVIKSTRRPRCKGVPFTVYKMKQDDFLAYDQKEYKKSLITNRKIKGCRFVDACYFKFSNSYRIGYEASCNYGTLLDNDMPGTFVRINKGKNISENNDLFKLHQNIPRKYNSPIPLKKEKLKDIRKLVHALVPKYCRRKYWDAIIGPVDDNSDNEEDLDDQLEDAALYEQMERGSLDEPTGNADLEEQPSNEPLAEDLGVSPLDDQSDDEEYDEQSDNEDNSGDKEDNSGDTEDNSGDNSGDKATHEETSEAMDYFSPKHFYDYS